MLHLCMQVFLLVLKEKDMRGLKISLSVLFIFLSVTYIPLYAAEGNAEVQTDYEAVKASLNLMGELIVLENEPAADETVFLKFTPNAAAKIAPGSGTVKAVKTAVTEKTISVGKYLDKAGILELYITKNANGAETVPHITASSQTYWITQSRQKLDGSAKPKISAEGYGKEKDKVLIANAAGTVYQEEADGALWRDGSAELSLDVYEYSVEYLFRIAPVAEGDKNALAPGATVSAGSKSAKLKIAGTEKAPAVKVDYLKNTLNLKVGDTEVSTSVSGEWEKITSDYAKNGLSVVAGKLVFDSGAYGTTLYFRKSATAKKPSSVPVMIIFNTAAPNSPATESFAVNAKGDKLLVKQSLGPIEYLSGTTWKKGAPKLTRDGTVYKLAETKVRFAATLTRAPSQTSTISYDGTKLTVTTDAPAAP